MLAMIRKAIIVVLTPLSFPAIILAVLSYWIPLVACTGSPVDKRSVRYVTANNKNAVRLVFRALWLTLHSALLATHPTIAFTRGPMLRWRRRRKGWCLKCGYDLTGNVTGACPECGARVEDA